MKKIKLLFQGDSITDACRDKSDYHNLGDILSMPPSILKKNIPVLRLNLLISA